MDNKLQIGLITYHAAYNFGSALQTYATIKTIESLGYEVETIDYRTMSQSEWYTVDYNHRKGKRELLFNIGFNFIKNEREERRNKYENFISSFLKPTGRRYKNYHEIKKESFDYDILISGSDQIWNIGCREFQREPIESILPYFLDFGNPRKRIAYASSFGQADKENIKLFKDYLQKFDFLSTREALTCEIIKEVTERDVKLVCDPTWLLSKQEWLKLPGIYKLDVQKPYILIYSLSWNFFKMRKWLKSIKKLAKKNNFDIIVISPLWFYKERGVKVLNNAGPLDFLSYLNNAALVITNTFHGTIFSMNFRVPFYSINAHPTSRQGQLLNLCRLEDRIIRSPEELATIRNFKADFTYSSKEIEKLRLSSIDYLKNALKT